MQIRKASIEYIRAPTDEEAEHEKELAEQVANLTNEQSRLYAVITELDQLTNGGEELEQIEEKEAEQRIAKVNQLEQELSEIADKLEGVNVQLERARTKRLVKVVVSEGTREQRLYQIQLLGELDDITRAWAIDSWRKANPEHADDPSRPTDDELDLTDMTRKQQRQWIVMGQATAVAAALVEEESENFDVPETLLGWCRVPDAIFEPALAATYGLNPNWRPDWTMEPENEPEKNASEPGLISNGLI